MLDTKYFEGQENITIGNRRGSDKVLAEVLNEKADATDLTAKADAADLTALTAIVTEKARVFISSEQTGTGAEQSIAHTLVDDNGDAVAPTAVLASITDDNNAAFSIVEGTHTTTELKMTVTLNAKYKVLAIY